MPKIQLDKEIDINKVLEFATKKHQGQKRDDGSEYIEHPIRVAKIVEKYKPNSLNKNILIAGALLHDTLEDTYTSYKELVDNFGEVVASLVVELTTAKYGCKMIGKAIYLAEKMQYMTNYALYIKLADRLDNISDLKGCSENKKAKMIADTKYFLEYLDKKRNLTKSQMEIKNEIQTKLNSLFKQ